MWTTTFYKCFFKNILLYMSSRLSKIRSVHKYVMARTVYFGWICTCSRSKRPWNSSEITISCDFCGLQRRQRERCCHECIQFLRVNAFLFIGEIGIFLSSPTSWRYIKWSAAEEPHISYAWRVSQHWDERAQFLLQVCHFPRCHTQCLINECCLWSMIIDHIQQNDDAIHKVL